MSDLPEIYHPTVEKIYQYYIDNNADFRRPHLGASLIGDDCCRKLWYSFRWAVNPNFNGRMLRLFLTGFKEESRIIKELRDIGICVYDRDPDSGKQLGYLEESCPHFSGSLDGIAKGFEEAEKTWHVLEIKTSSSKAFSMMKRDGVKKAKPLHYSQMQTYMRWSGLDRAFYFMVNKDTDEIYAERVYYDKEHSESLIAKAKYIVFSDSPVERVSDKPGNFKCRYCDYCEICHEGKLPLVSCRTCAFVTPRVDGKWICGRDENVLGESKQKAGCDRHIFNPALVPLEQTDADPEKGTITYGDITNGPGAIASRDLERAIRCQ